MQPPRDLEGPDLLDYHKELVLSLQSSREHAVSSLKKSRSGMKSSMIRRPVQFLCDVETGP